MPELVHHGVAFSETDLELLESDLKSKYKNHKIQITPGWKTHSPTCLSCKGHNYWEIDIYKI